MKTNNLTIEKWIRWIIYLIVFALWVKGGISTEGDAITYINMDPHRSSGFPLFIKLTTLFGLIHSYRVTTFIALALGLYITYRFVNFLKEQFEQSTVSVAVTYMILLMPYLVSHLANAVLTEILAYPLFILSVHLFLRSVYEKNKRIAIFYMIVVGLLLLVRSQFVFFHIISVLLIIYLTWYSKNKTKQAFTLTGVFVLVILANNLVERTYHLMLHKHFAVSPFIGVQLETMPLYNLQDNDINLFSDTLERGVIDTVLGCEKKSDLYNIRTRRKARTAEYESFKFLHSYSLISWQSSEKYIQNECRKKGLYPNDMSFWIYLDKVTTHIAITLIKAHPNEYLWLYLVNFNAAFGDLEFLFPFMILLISSIFFFFRTGNKTSVFMLLACLLMLANVTLTCFFEPPLDRYVFYTQNLLLVIILIPVYKLFEGVAKEEKHSEVSTSDDLN